MALPVLAILLAADAVAQTVSESTPSQMEGRFSLATVGGADGDIDITNDNVASTLSDLGELVGPADAALIPLGAMIVDKSTFNAFRLSEAPRRLSQWSPPAATTLRDLGFDLVARANDTSFGWGARGWADTTRHLEMAGLTHAGAGLDGVAARKPAIFASAKGPVALVSATTSFAPMTIAGDVGTPGESRGGVFGLRSQQILLATPEEMSTLRKVSARQDFEGTQVHDPKQLIIGGFQSVGLMVYRESASPGQTWEINDSDRAALISAIKDAQDSAGFVALALHSQERQPDGQPADFIPDLLHQAIDAGADLVVGSGGNSLGAIEIYRGKPIFYDLGNFISTLATQDRFNGEDFPKTPSSGARFEVPENWRDSAVAVTEFDDGVVCRIRIYPLRISAIAGQRGVPLRAHGKDARRILDQVRERSAVHGTLMRIEGDIGVITPGKPLKPC